MKRKTKARIEELERRVRELEARPLPALPPIYVEPVRIPGTPLPYSPPWIVTSGPIETGTIVGNPDPNTRVFSSSAVPLVVSGTVSPLNVSPVSTYARIPSGDVMPAGGWGGL